MARRGGNWILDVIPMVVLAGAGIALVQEPGRHKARRLEPGRGRGARSLREIPLRGWKDIGLRTAKEFTDDQIPMIAAGVTFYSLLALFPALGAFVALYGLFADVTEVQKHLHLLSFMLPPDALRFIGEQMLRMATAKTGGLSMAFVVSLLVSIWSANGAVKALMTGLNTAYEEHESRGFVKRTLVSLVFTLGYLAFAISAIGLLAAGPAIQTFFGQHAALVFGWISWPILLVGLVLALAVLYRFGPSRDPVRWRWLTWGSVVAVLLWVGASGLFSLYVGNFAHYDRTYGPLGTVIGFMTWTWISAMVILMGAELNSEIEHQTTVDTTTGAPEPMGFRRARMADTIGAAQGR
jgi:membrane protein